MIPISEALKIIKRETFPLGSETTDLENSVGRVLAQEIRADMDLPPFDRSQMDGFAVRSGDTENAPVKLKIIGESVAGKGFDGELKTGEAIRIMTGARVPGGADAIQKVELTAENNKFVDILEKTSPHQHINLYASEIQNGEKIFGQGEVITEQMIAALASFGYAKVEVFERPKLSILSTGSEIVNIDETPQKDQIRNSNSMMLKVFAEKSGAKAEILPHVQDDFETLKRTIAENYELRITNYELKHQSPKSKIQNPKSPTIETESHIAHRTSQILILTGGVSVGDYDFTKPVLRELGAEIFFEKISLKPGKPTVFAKLNDTLIFGLPGNPVSSAVTFYLFVRTAILLMQSAKNFELKKGFAVASEKIKGAKERDSVLPISLLTNEKGQLIIESLRFSGSSNFIAFARADAFVFVPQGKNLEKGDIAQIMFLSGKY